MSIPFVELTTERTRALLQTMVGRRVAVIGDVMLDQYLLGEVDRISPEAPVPVLQVRQEELMLGGAANVAKCLVALGAEVRLASVIGDDADADLFSRECVDIGIPDGGLIRDIGRHTTRKTRVIAGQQQMVRIDRESLDPISEKIDRDFVDKIRANVEWADAIVVSDYSKGVLSESACRSAIQAAGERPTVVDPKYLPWDQYKGASLIKPNEREAEWYSGGVIRDDLTAETCGRVLVENLGVEYALVTRGSAGMILVDRNEALNFTSRRLALRDVTGCGDIVAATVTLALASGASAATASWLANAAGSIGASKFGVAPVAGQEILASLSSDLGRPDSKVFSQEQAASFAATCRSEGRQVVFTNGCFDILHVGHTNYLERSSECGDALIIGVNTDSSVRRLKGPGRPLQSEVDRAQILASLACVDAVVLFEEDTPLKLIEDIRPDVITKGSDYKRGENVVGWDFVRSNGGRVELIPIVAGRSTTEVLDKARV